MSHQGMPRPSGGVAAPHDVETPGEHAEQRATRATRDRARASGPCWPASAHRDVRALQTRGQHPEVRRHPSAGLWGAYIREGPLMQPAHTVTATAALDARRPRSLTPLRRVARVRAWLALVCGPCPACQCPKQTRPPDTAVEYVA
jgi:hypothetical protein